LFIGRKTGGVELTLTTFATIHAGNTGLNRTPTWHHRKAVLLDHPPAEQAKNNPRTGDDRL
jgi:hypothetical protein